MILARNNFYIEEVIAGCVAKDARCQKLLFEKFASRMLGICLRYCKNYDAAKDAMQIGFINIFEKIGSFKGDSKFETWMTRIMINNALNELRRNNKYGLIEDIAGMSETLEGTEDVDANAVSRMSYDELIEILQTIPDGYRVVFNMYAIEGYSHKEIAETLGINEGTSKSQLNRARKYLQELVQKRLGIEYHVQG